MNPLLSAIEKLANTAHHNNNKIKELVQNMDVLKSLQGGSKSNDTYSANVVMSIAPEIAYNANVVVCIN